MATAGNVVVAVFIIGLSVFLGTSSVGNSTSTTSIVCPTSPCPFNNPNSQKVADLMAKYAYDSQVQMMHDVNEPGCNDYESGAPCDSTYWTTSDNIPTAWTMSDYGYPNIQNAIIPKVNGLGALNPNSQIFGNRYEAYVGVLTGTSQQFSGTHGIIKDQIPGPVILAVATGNNYSPMSNFWSSGGSSGTNSFGRYSIQYDASSAGAPHTGLSVDTEAPQAIDQWLLGNKPLGLTLVNDLVNRYVSSNWIGSGSTWQLGQVLFVMRVYGLDSSNPSAFNAGVSKLWSLQSTAGYLPNSYTALGPGSGHDPENMDAGLLPFSYTVVTMIQNDYGKYAGPNQTYNQNQACITNHPGSSLPEAWTISCSFSKQVHAGDQLTAYVMAGCSSSCSWSWSAPTDTEHNSYVFTVINNTVAYSAIAQNSGLIIIQVLLTNLAPVFVQNPTIFISEVHPVF